MWGTAAEPLGSGARQPDNQPEPTLVALSGARHPDGGSTPPTSTTSQPTTSPAVVHGSLYDVLCYAPPVGDVISVRLDEDARRALAELEAAGMTRSDAVRRGLVAAAQRLRDRQRLLAEAAALADDEDDRAEAAAVAQMMEDLRAPW
jgi:hypothetical protein